MILRANSFLGKKFRRRFRLPYALFQKVKACCIEKGIFKSKHRSPIPIEFKILISLRILGRGNCCDDLNEFSSVGESTCNTIFHTFVKEFVEHFFVDFVSMPSAETLKQSLDIYAKLGLPGAVLSWPLSPGKNRSRVNVILNGIEPAVFTNPKKYNGSVMPRILWHRYPFLINLLCRKHSGNTDALGGFAPAAETSPDCDDDVLPVI